MVTKSDGRYEAGDRAGRSGLQAQYDETLAGATGIRVTASGDGGATLFEKAATDGADVETTLDPTVQEAAEKALADSKLKVPGAVVAVDVKSGEVLAVANSPTTGFDRALTGHYPPGSTFKVATSYAYLTRGITTPAAKVPCPASVTVDGREFTNFAGESVSGSPTFFQDFTISCNTAFVGLSGKLGDDDLTHGRQGARHRRRLGRHPRCQRHLRRQRAGHQRRHRHRGRVDRPGPGRGVAGRRSR